MSHLIDGELVTPCSTTIVAQHFQSICEAVAKLESKLLDQFDDQNKSKTLQRINKTWIYFHNGSLYFLFNSSDHRCVLWSVLS